MESWMDLCDWCGVVILRIEDFQKETIKEIESNEPHDCSKWLITVN